MKSILIMCVCCVLVACGASNDKSESKTEEAVDSVTIVLNATEAQSVFELLRSTHEVESRSSSMGLFVRGIDSIVNSSSAFWLYSVNDSMAKTACDKYMLEPGDKLTWHFRKM